jgi:hypothetical protein
MFWRNLLVNILFPLHSRFLFYFCVDSNHLDPHMESLCRRVRKLSVAASNVVQDETTNELVDSNFGFEQKTSKNTDVVNEIETDDEIQVN